MSCRVNRLVFAVAVLTAALSVPTRAAAQGAYYREVVKDGRIYVFNNPTTFSQFDGSGEIGVGAIVLIGTGPNGETMVFDSENAIHLYNFKHDRPGEVVKSAASPSRPPTMQVSWKDGKTSITTDNAQLNISNRIQARFTQQMPDDTVQLAGTAAKGESVGSFRLRRAKFKMDGWFYKKELTYEVQMNWTELGGSAPGNALEDVDINWDVSKKGAFQVKFGQFKVPFGRQELTSSGSQQFVDRSLVSNEFAKGRDTGVQVWGLAFRQRVDWRLGVFNGNGRTRPANDNSAYQFNGRVTFQPWGDAKFSESDFESVDKPLVAFGVGFDVNDMRNTNADRSKNLKRTVVGADAVMKYKGLSLTGEYFDRTLDPQGPVKPTDSDPASYGSNGYYAQAGYLFAKRRWEVALRYGSWDPTDLKAGNDRTETGVALSYFYNKHNLKVQSDFRKIEDRAANTKDYELRVQTQFIF